MTSPDASLLTTRQVADILNLSINSVYRYVQRGDLRARRLGGRTLRFHPDDVARLAGPIGNRD